MPNYKYSGVLRDQFGRPVPGAQVAVDYAFDESPVSLFDANGFPISNPFRTNDLGDYEFYVAIANSYILNFYYGGRRVYSEQVIIGPYAGEIVGSVEIPPFIVTDNTQAVFTLPVLVTSSVVVYLNGDRQLRSSYSVAGPVVTLDPPARKGDEVVFVVSEMAPDQGFQNGYATSILGLDGNGIAVYEPRPHQSLLAKLPWQRVDDVLNGTISPSFDATAYIQEALDYFAGQIIELPRGILYPRKTMFVSANTDLRLGSDVKLITNTAAWIDSGIETTLTGGTGGADIGFLIANKNWNASSRIDENICISGGQYIRDLDGVGRKGHAIMLRKALRSKFDRVHGIGGWNTFAILNSRDVTVSNSSGLDNANASFDTWEGSEDIKFDTCVSRTSPGREIAQAFMASGMATDGTPGNTRGIQYVNCSAYGVRRPTGFASAFIANAIGVGSSVSDVQYVNCYADDGDLGFVAQGDVTGVTGVNNVLRNIDAGPVLYTSDPSGEPSGCFLNATLIDCASGNALVSIRGRRNKAHVRVAGTYAAAAIVRFETTAKKCEAIIDGVINEAVPVVDDNPTGLNCAEWRDVNDSVVFTKGSGNADVFTLGKSFRQLLQSGATGNFEAIHVEMDAREYGTAGKFNVGVQGIGRSNSSGNVFGLAGYAQIGASGAASAEACGGEFNTDVRCATVARKTGVQAVDVSTSVGAGSAIDAAFWAARQVGGVGYLNGVQFGTGSDSEFAVKAGTTNALLSVKAGSGVTIGYGLDANDLSFAQAAIGLRAQAVGHRISWGIGSNANRDGGEIRSDASTAAGKIIFTNGGLVVQNSGGTLGISVDGDGTNPVNLTVAGATKKVQASASPPGGSLLLYVAP